MGLCLGIHAPAGVGYRESGIAACRANALTAPVLLLTHYPHGFEDELAARRHGIAGVRAEIHQDLAELAGIGLHRTYRVVEDDRDLNILAHQPFDHALYLADRLIQIHNRLGAHLSAAEGQQLTGEQRGLFGCPLDFPIRLGGAIVQSLDALDDGGIAEDYSQQIVKVMGDPASQAADRLHPLGVA